MACGERPASRRRGKLWRAIEVFQAEAKVKKKDPEGLFLREKRGLTACREKKRTVVPLRRRSGLLSCAGGGRKGTGGPRWSEGKGNLQESLGGEILLLPTKVFHDHE